MIIYVYVCDAGMHVPWRACGDQRITFKSQFPLLPCFEAVSYWPTSSQGFSCLQPHVVRNAGITDPVTACCLCGFWESALCSSGLCHKYLDSPRHLPGPLVLLTQEQNSEDKWKCLPCNSNFSFSGHCHRYKAEKTEGLKPHLLFLTLFDRQLSGILSKNNTPSVDRQEDSS